jgi:4-amino-4-deoxy-L-arabinose transferase-like glycosyltransferase
VGDARGLSAVAVDAPRGRVGRFTWAREHPATTAWAAVGALTALALALRVALVHESLFGDELFLYAIVHDHSLGQAMTIVHDTEKTPPLFFLMAWVIDRVGGAPELIRLPSVIAGAACVPLTYLIGRRTVGRAAALAAATWLAISAFQLVYGTEARAYSLVTALVLGSTLALLNAVDGRDRRWWALYGLLALAAIYTHYIAALVLLPQAAWALWTHRETLREHLIVSGLIALAYLPWLPSFLVQRDHSAAEARRISIISPVNLDTVPETLARAVLGTAFVPTRALPGHALTLLAAGALAVALLAAIGRWATRPDRGWARTSAAAALVLVLAIVPPVALLLYSLRPHSSFFLARNLLVCLPYFLIVVGWLITSTRPRALAFALGAVILAALAVGTVDSYDPVNMRTDGRGAARFIDAHARPADPVLDVQYPFAGAPATGTAIYLRRAHRSVFSVAEAWAAAAAAHGSLVLSFPDLSAFRRELRPPQRYGGHFRLVAQRRLPGLRTIVVQQFAWR